MEVPTANSSVDVPIDKHTETDTTILVKEGNSYESYSLSNGEDMVITDDNGSEMIRVISHN